VGFFLLSVVAVVVAVELVRVFAAATALAVEVQ
jgi:hypothetical protein